MMAENPTLALPPYLEFARNTQRMRGAQNSRLPSRKFLPPTRIAAFGLTETKPILPGEGSAPKPPQFEPSFRSAHEKGRSSARREQERRRPVRLGRDGRSWHHHSIIGESHSERLNERGKNQRRFRHGKLGANADAGACAEG